MTRPAKFGMINLNCFVLSQDEGRIFMEQQTLLDRLFLAMVEYEKGTPHRIAHFAKVHAYAALIARQEGLTPQLQLITEAAALVHDIGIRPSLEKYHSSAGKYQELEGPAPAGEMLRRLGFEEPVKQRVCFLVSRHHTYHPVEGMDHQILLEADFLVNAMEESMSEQAIRTGREKVFATKTGLALLDAMYPL